MIETVAIDALRSRRSIWLPGRVVDELARIAPELGRASALVFLQADICRRELDVEIEGHAWVQGDLA